MFSRRTIFIIGAGCSMEFELPDGRTLRENILTEINSPSHVADSEIGAAYFELCKPVTNGELQRHIQMLKRGLFAKPSIDQYLEFHESNQRLVTLGKLALARSIIHLEQSKIGRNGLLTMGANKYIENILHAMNARVKRENLREMFQNVTFITFNYDRIIETYISDATMALAGGMSQQEMQSILSALKVTHVYGQAGRTEWNLMADSYTGLPMVPFGVEKVNYQVLAQVAQGLRTFSEGLEDENIQSDIAAAFEVAEDIVIMGFSYIPENLRLFEHPTPRLKNVYALTCGLSGQDAAHARNELYRIFDAGEHRIGDRIQWQPTLQMFDQKAAKFTSDYAAYFQR